MSASGRTATPGRHASTAEPASADRASSDDRASTDRESFARRAADEVKTENGPEAGADGTVNRGEADINPADADAAGGTGSGAGAGRGGTDPRRRDDGRRADDSRREDPARPAQAHRQEDDGRRRYGAAGEDDGVRPHGTRSGGETRPGADRRRLVVDEPARTPVPSLLFGYGAMVPLVLAALLVFAAPPILAPVVRDLGLVWGAAIILFLSGVRRGVSFRTPNGPTAAQLAMMVWLFAAGLGALLAVFAGRPATAGLLEIAAYLSLAALDPRAARRGETPLFFARLRPLQMMLPVAALAVMLAGTASL